jgi:hypothetical protein
MTIATRFAFTLRTPAPAAGPIDMFESFAGPRRTIPAPWPAPDVPEISGPENSAKVRGFGCPIESLCTAARSDPRGTTRLRAPAVADTMRAMGKRSGVPHRDDELAALDLDALRAELERSRIGLSISGSAKMAKQWHKRIHWLESAIAERA